MCKQFKNVFFLHTQHKFVFSSLKNYYVCIYLSLFLRTRQKFDWMNEKWTNNLNRIEFERKTQIFPHWEGISLHKVLEINSRLRNVPVDRIKNRWLFIFNLFFFFKRWNINCNWHGQICWNRRKNSQILM